MQQKLLGSTLYVFQVEPYEITEDTSAEIIKVQEECVAGFKTLNASLADKIVAYNYHAIVAQVPVWAPYVDDVSPELAWSSDSATVTIGADDNVFPTLTNPHNVTVTYSSSDTTKATIDASTGAITLAAAGNTTISATFAGNDTYYAQTVSYALTVEEAQKQSPELAWSSNSATVTIGADDNVFPTLSNPNSVSPITYNSTVTGVATVDEYGNITLVSAGTTDIWAIFAGNDTYTEQVVTYRLNVEEAQVQTYGIILSGGHLDATKFTAKINNVVATPVTTEEPEPDDWTYDYGLYQAGTVFDVYPTESASNYEADPDLIWDTDHWTATVSDEDLIRDLAYIESEEQPE